MGIMKTSDKQRLVRQFYNNQSKCRNIYWLKDEMKVSRAYCGLTNKPCSYNNCPGTKKF